MSEPAIKELAPLIEVEPFGQLNKQEAKLYTLRNKNGLSASITDYGATLVSFSCPDGTGQFADIVLGFDTLQGYLDSDAYMGATVGRFANRIANGEFKLNGKHYTLDKNGGPNHLHGGVSGFNSRIWHSQIIESQQSALRFTLFSPDGDQGYPGNLTIHVTYTLTDSDQLIFEAEAVCDNDTPISITNHSYFNLAGRGSIEDHYLQIFSDLYTPLDDQQVPTGELAKVENTPLDFKRPKRIGKDIDNDDVQIKIGSGYDHNFMTAAAESKTIEAAAEIEDRQNGRTLTIFTDSPGLQLYTANFLSGSKGKGVEHKARHALCLEPQQVPDAPNKAQFPSCILKAGQRFKTTTIFEASTN